MLKMGTPVPLVCLTHMATASQPWWAFPLLLSIYLMSAWNMVILDCDETFNYLEPLHYLLYGHGLQTWEYGPQFALRPYSFLLLLSAPLKLVIKIFRIHDKVTQSCPLISMYVYR